MPVGLDRLPRHPQNPVPGGQLRRQWNGIFTPRPCSVSLARSGYSVVGALWLLL